MTRKTPIQGLGDKIENITEATGIKKAVELFTEATGIDCGCDKRKQILNKLFPSNQPKCFNQVQFDKWSEVRERVKSTKQLNDEDQNTTIELLKDILNMSISNQSCRNCNPSLWIKYIDMLNKVYDTYDTTNQN